MPLRRGSERYLSLQGACRPAARQELSLLPCLILIAYIMCSYFEGPLYALPPNNRGAVWGAMPVAKS